MFGASVLYKNGRYAVLGPNIKFRRWDILACIIFTIVFGLRYNVGIDYANYTDSYILNDFERMEFLFRSISEFLVSQNVHITVFFSLWVFLQIFFLIISFKNEKFLLPALIFTLFAGQYFLLWMNVIRQDVAACIFIFSITFIVQKSFIKYLLCIVVAFGFHKTAILLLLIYPILRYHKNYFNNIFIQFFLLFISIFLGVKSGTVMNSIDSLLESFMVMLGYENYGFGGIESSVEDVRVGMSFITSLLIDIFTIAYSNKMKLFYSNNKFECYYDLYFVGVIAYMLFAKSYILLRPFRYFKFFKMIISAYLLYYLFKNGNSKINVLSFIILICLYLLQYMAIFRYSPDACYIYNFFW